MNKTITIDKGIPIVYRSKYPIAQLEIGDSFFIENFKSHAHICGLFCQYKRNNPTFDYVSSLYIQNGIEGRRYWRTA